MSGPSDRALYLGLDAFDPGLLEAGAREGTLPALARLLARGAVARVENPPALYVGAVWPSFWTSRSPARHGRYCFRQHVPGTYRERAVGAEDVPDPPFWRAFGAAGRSTLVFDVPKVAPDREIRGSHVVDWGTHDPDPAGLRSHPPGLAAEVREALGPAPVPACDEVRRTAAEYRAFAEGLLERIRRRESWLAPRLPGDVDVVIACLAEAHCAGHQAWHLHDSGHERHDPALAAATGDVLLEVYRALDASVGRLAEAAGDRRVMVHASHGMGPHHDGTPALDEMLERLEPALPAGHPPGLRGRFARLVDRRRTRRWSRRFQRRFGRALPIPSRHAARLCFAVPNNEAWAGIRVNVAGREPAGRVEAGAALEAFVAALGSRLAEVRDGTTGAPVFDRVHATRDLYPGADTSHLPDVVARWRRGRPITSLVHPLAGRVESRYRGVRTGDHREEGLVIALGPGLRPGPVPDAVRVEDLGPTLGAWLGVPLPGVDGRPVPSLVP
jgi:predicted AlkP superfamily phosphohydrolase/phosphomutase